MRFSRRVLRRTFPIGSIVVGLLAAAGGTLGAEERPTGTNYLSPRLGASRLAAPTADLTQLLQCLVGPDVVVSNATLSAAPQAAGTFAGASRRDRLRPGDHPELRRRQTLSGPNLGDSTSTVNLSPGDPDLDGLIPGYTTFDSVVLEFDFSCTSAQEVVFQYVFGSEEYNEYVNSPFNDVFGFFLNGANIAVAPAGCSGAGAPVSINNVNCGNPYVGAGPNCNCFRNNDLDDGGGSINTELDGLTQVFHATGTIQAGTNHIKIAIADAGDQVLDSDVMIRCQSFTCGAAPVTGACCLPAGPCVTLTSADCAANGGTYHGDASSCVPSPCGASSGACCLPNQACEVESPDSCATAGGVYQGDVTACVPNPCGAPIAACCFGTSSCELTDPFSCIGTYLPARRRPAIRILAPTSPAPAAPTSRSARSGRWPSAAATPSSASAPAATRIRATRSSAPAATTTARAGSRSRTSAPAATSTWGIARSAIPTRAGRTPIRSSSTASIWATRRLVDRPALAPPAERGTTLPEPFGRPTSPRQAPPSRTLFRSDGGRRAVRSDRDRPARDGQLARCAPPPAAADRRTSPIPSSRHDGRPGRCVAAREAVA